MPGRSRLLLTVFAVMFGILTAAFMTLVMLSEPPPLEEVQPRTMANFGQPIFTQANAALCPTEEAANRLVAAMARKELAVFTQYSHEICMRAEEGVPLTLAEGPITLWTRPLRVRLRFSNTEPTVYVLPAHVRN